MTRCIFTLILIFNLTLNSQGQLDNPREHVAVQSVVNGLFEGLAELNVEKMRSFCSPDITILETGEVWNFDTLAIRVARRKARVTDFKRINKLDFFETNVSGNIAWVSYVNHATITASGKTASIKWLESVVLIKNDAEWKISLLHSTKLE